MWEPFLPTLTETLHRVLVQSAVLMDFFAALLYGGAVYTLPRALLRRSADRGVRFAKQFSAGRCGTGGLRGGA
jgi:hypothetical protein